VGAGTNRGSTVFPGADGSRIEVEDIQIPGGGGPAEGPRGGSSVKKPSQRPAASAGLTVGVVGKVHQPGIYRFESARGDLVTLVKAAGGLTSEASGGLRVIREGRYINVEVPYRINDSVTYHPRMRFDLFPGDMVVVRGRADGAKDNGGLPPTLDSAGRPIYAPLSAKDFTFEQEKAPPPREQPVANIGVLGVGPRPVLLRLPAGGSTLEDILTRLNQPTTGNGLVTVVKPGEGPLSVRWTDAKNIGMVGDTVCVFDAKTLDTSSLPEFAEPVVIPGEAAERIARGADAAPDRARPIVLHSPYGKGSTRSRSVEPRGGVAVGTNDIPAPSHSALGQPALGQLAPSQPEASPPNLASDVAMQPGVEGAASVPAPALPPLADPEENVPGSDAASSVVSAPVVSGETIADMAAMPTLRDPGEGAIRVIPEAPIRIPGQSRRLTDESHLDRQPLPAELARADSAGDNLVPAPMADIDLLSANTGAERFGMLAAGIALFSTLCGLAAVALNERRRGVAVAAAARPLSRLDALIENQLEVFEEPVRVPENLVLYGSPLPQGDRYYIDQAQEVPAPHFPQTADSRAVGVEAGGVAGVAPLAPPVSVPENSAAGHSMSTEQAAGGDPAAKVIRLDGSHPATDKGAGGRSDMGLLDRVLLNKRGTR
jgi:hypothetical protein